MVRRSQDLFVTHRADQVTKLNDILHQLGVPLPLCTRTTASLVDYAIPGRPPTVQSPDYFNLWHRQVHQVNPPFA